MRLLMMCRRKLAGKGTLEGVGVGKGRASRGLGLACMPMRVSTKNATAKKPCMCMVRWQSKSEGQRRSVDEL